jgi:hypothetical protein
MSQERENSDGSEEIEPQMNADESRKRDLKREFRWKRRN